MMTEEQKQKLRQRQLDSKQIAEQLKLINIDITQTDVHTYLYNEIKDKGEEFLQSVLKGENFDVVLNMLGFFRWKERKVIGYRQEQTTIKQKSNSKATSELKLALWYINKIGSVERAKHVFDIAIATLEKL